MSLFINFRIFLAGATFLLLYSTLILIDSSIKNKSIKVGFLSIGAVFTQLFGYGVGFIEEMHREVFKR